MVLCAGHEEEQDKVKIAQLAEKIVAHRRAYYGGEPKISDQEYDTLEDELRELAPDHPLLQAVGSEPEFDKVAHEIPMLSLQKTYSLRELLAWQKSQPLVGTLKIDGNSLSLVYRGGHLQSAKTRGDGYWGENVTVKAMHVPDIPISLSDERVLEVRGELHCEEGDFFRLANAMAEVNLPRPSSPRNVVAGLLGRKGHHHLGAYFSFIAYDLIYPAMPALFASEMDKLDVLTKMGFKLAEPRLLRTSAEIEAYLEFTQGRMENAETEIDGAVFSFSALDYARTLGATAHHPRARMSFKWQGKTAVTRIVEITWHTSRLGNVTPVAEVEPVELSNATIRRVTLHNYSYVKLYELKRGDRIKIVRSGEVIPKFLAVEEASAGEVEIPRRCPRCEGELEDDGVRLFCISSSCPAQRLLAILNWVRCVDIRDLSEKRLSMLVERGFVKSIPDLYRLNVEMLLQMPLTKEKMAQKLLANIARTKKLSAERFLTGLGIKGAGRTTWRNLLRKAGSVDGILRMTVEEIVATEGFAEKSAEQIVHGLAARGELIAELYGCGVELEEVRGVGGEDAGGAGVLRGQRFVITGALSQPRERYREVIEEHGGDLSSAVSKNTSAVITGDPSADSTKLKQARKLRIRVIDEDEFWEMVKK